VALDRESIEKKDFPVGRRGYDPQAVEAHLRTVADQVEEFRRSTQQRRETLAAAASEQVQSIVEAAEGAAARIQNDAEEESRQIVREARRDAKNTREEATSQAEQYVSNVSAATSGMLERVDAMDSELGTLVDTLRTAGQRLGADLQLLQGTLQEVKDAVTPSRHVEFEPEEEEIVSDLPAAGAEAVPPSAVPAAGDQDETDVYDEATRAAGPSEPGTAEYAEAPAAEGGDDVEGARLIALNMALNGTPRDEVDRYLAENFQLSDRAALIEEVYASVEG
jgi:DivIVA domain-containing protein